MTSKQQAILLLWQRVNTSLSAFYKLTKYFGTASLALQQTSEAWQALKIHKTHVIRHQEANEGQDKQFIDTIKQRIANDEFKLLFADEPLYPPYLLQLFDPPPLLFYRGQVARLTQAQIAIVGSRKPTVAAQKFTFDMAQYLAQSGYVITSGLAQGVDAQAHLGALAQSSDAQGSTQGRTVGVMGTGIDVCYPTQHKALMDRIVGEGGCIISELLPNTQPNKHTFPRRNRIVAGLSLGTIVTEAALKSGSLITARLTSEQGKQVFAMPSSIDNVNAEGCHHLIREGATLVYHPNHVIDEIARQIIAPLSSNDLPFDDLLPDNSPSTDLPSDSSSSDLIPPKPISEYIVDNKKPPAPSQPHSKPSKTSFTTTSTAPLTKKMPVQTATKQPKQAVSVPEHLQPVWVHIDNDGHDLDALINKTSLETSTLLSQLMDLELLGAITQIGGRYKRQ